MSSSLAARPAAPPDAAPAVDRDGHGHGPSAHSHAAGHDHAHGHHDHSAHAAPRRAGAMVPGALSVLRLSLTTRLGIAAALLAPLWIAVFLVVRGQP